MFQNLFRYWVRQTLEEALRQKAAELSQSAPRSTGPESKPTSSSPASGVEKGDKVTQTGAAEGKPPGSENLPPVEVGPAGCEAEAGLQEAGSAPAQPGPPAGSLQLQPVEQQKSEKAVAGCDVGVVFALESESGGLEDLLKETGRWRGDGFTAIAGRLEDRLVVMVRSGAGLAAAAHATEALLDGHRPRWVISAGFAGALQPQLQRYDLVLPEAVIRPDGPRLELSPPSHWLAQTAFGSIHQGLLVSVEHLASSPKEKRSLGEKYGALAVDMETFGVVEVCQRRAVPVVAVRIIIDQVDEQLPPEVRGLLKQKTAAARLGAALGALWHRPSSWKDLYRLKEQALLASDRLARFLAWAIAKLR